jgi:hypothetical protein
MDKISIKVEKLNEIFEDYPNKKKEVKKALNFDRSTMHKILNGKRKVEVGEWLTIARVVNTDPYELAA